MFSGLVVVLLPLQKILSGFRKRTLEDPYPSLLKTLANFAHIDPLEPPLIPDLWKILDIDTPQLLNCLLSTLLSLYMFFPQACSPLNYLLHSVLSFIEFPYLLFPLREIQTIFVQWQYHSQ